MREIDEVRIILSRLLSHTAQFPSALIDEMLKASQFVKRHMASIKVNAYGRGLLVRLRDLKQVTIRRTHTILGMYRRYGRDIETHLYMRWDYKAIFARARGDRALRRSRKALGLPGRSLREWHSGFSYAIWRRWIGRKTAVEDHYVHRNRLGVKLLDFGEP
jgi:hypothetical protein